MRDLEINSTQPLKRSESGIELEMHLLDEKGASFPGVKQLIEQIKKDRKSLDIDTEVCKNVVELRSFPSVKLRKVLPALLDDYASLIESAEKIGCKIYPLAVYPGKIPIKPVMKRRYLVQAKVFGIEKCRFCWGHCNGFHYHYTLPRGVFDKKKKFLKPLTHSKTMQSLIDSYNLAIAVDPALTTFMQSSPFVEGNYLAKDSRLLLIRGGKNLGYEKALFNELPELGQLPPYIYTASDLIDRLKYLDALWKQKLKENKMNEEIKKKKLLDFVWNPVKINKIGTLELRGADINHPKYVVAASVLLKFALRLIHYEFYTVKPSDIGKKEPFKVEGKTIHVPPVIYLRKKLQSYSVYEGLESDVIYDYCKRFYRFARDCVFKEYRKALAPFSNILSRRKTVSDVLIGKVKRMGYSLDEPIPEAVCRELALKSTMQLEKELEKTKNLIPDLE